MREDLEGSVAKLARLGYDGVELAVRNPELIDVSTLTALLSRHGLRASALGTGQAYFDEGLSISDPDPAFRRKAVERLKAHIRLSEELGCLVIIGLIRGKVAKGTTKSDALRWATEALSECAQLRPGALVVEPINRYETDLINTLDEAAQLCADVGPRLVRILADTFHMNIEERNPIASLKKHAALLGHIHFADSNRWAPGWGHIDFASHIKALREADYKGFISVEILPRPSPDTCAEEAIKHLRTLDP